MEKINIGLFLDTFFPMIDGVINVVDNYAKRLKKFADVTVFVPKIKKGKVRYDDSQLPYKVVRCKCFKLFFIDYDMPVPSLDSKFKKAIQNANLDIIHIHSPFYIGKMAVKFAKENNIPCVGTFHSQFKKDFLRATKSKAITNMLLKKIMKVFNSCDECWAVNKEIGEVFKTYGYNKEPLVYNNGTDLDLVEDEKESDDIVNKTYNINANENVFLFVGRINVLKNILFIIDALKIVKDKGKTFKMMFVGTGQDEDLLKKYVSEKGLKEDVIICGKVTDREMMRNIYHRAKLFLFPSLYDSSSLVQIEAASQKTPTIFLEGAVTAGTVTKDVNGFITENSAEKYADKIIEILNNDEYYKSVAENAYRDLYVSWDNVVEGAYKKYLELIDKKKVKN